MSRIGNEILQAEQEAAERELFLWSAGSALKDALRQGDPWAQQIMSELRERQEEESK